MLKFKVIILICSAALNHASCDEKTAVDVVPAMKVKNELQCGFMGQSGLATSAIRPDPKTQFIKVKCQPLPQEQWERDQ